MQLACSVMLSLMKQAKRLWLYAFGGMLMPQVLTFLASLYNKQTIFVSFKRSSTTLICKIANSNCHQLFHHVYSEAHNSASLFLLSYSYVNC